MVLRCLQPKPFSGIIIKHIISVWCGRRMAAAFEAQTLIVKLAADSAKIRVTELAWV
jgi:hypothetical protein